MEISPDGTSIIIDKQEYRLEGVPEHVWMNGAPSAFQDPKVLLPIVDRVEEPAEGGFLCYYKGQKYPRKGVVTPDALVAATVVKRLIKTTSFLAFNLLKVFWSPRRMFWVFLDWYVENSHNALERFYMVPHKCCTFVREVFRAGVEAIKPMKLTDEERVKLHRALMSIGLIAEFDDGWRYRCQDGLGELNKANFEKNPVKELMRIYGIMVERDGFIVDGKKQGGATKPRLGKVFLLLRFALILFSSFKSRVKHFVRELDLEKIKLDDADFYQCMPRYDYQYRGIDGRTRLQMRKQIDEDYKKQQMELKKANYENGKSPRT